MINVLLEGLPNRQMEQLQFDEANAKFYTDLPEYARQLNETASGINSIAAGGGFSIPYTFSTTITDADPGAGYLRLNNATQNAATVVRADLTGGDGTLQTAVLDKLDDSNSTVKGQIRLVKLGDPSKWLAFNLISTASPAGYRNFTVVPVGGSSASPFVNGDSIVLFFTRTGDVGTPGTQLRRSATIVSSPTPTPNATNTDVFVVTALAEPAVFGAPTGAPLEGQVLMLRIKDNGTARALAFNVAYRNGTDLVLPASTTAGKWLRLGFEYNLTDAKWDFIGMLNNI